MIGGILPKDEIGRTVFLTRDKAEAALKEMEDKKKGGHSKLNRGDKIKNRLMEIWNDLDEAYECMERSIDKLSVVRLKKESSYIKKNRNSIKILI